MLNVDVEMEYVQVDCAGGVGDVGDSVDFEHDVTAASATRTRMRPRTPPPKQRVCRVSGVVCREPGAGTGSRALEAGSREIDAGQN
jgi:hypothetical protein